MAGIVLINYLTLRKTCTILFILLCLAILSIYIASERQQVTFYVPDITFIDENTMTNQPRFDMEVNKGKGTSRDKQIVITPSTDHESSSFLSSTTATSETNLAKQAVNKTMNSLSTVSVSSVLSSKRSGTEISSSSVRHSISSQSQTVNAGLHQTSFNKVVPVYMNSSQDFNPVAKFANKTVTEIENISYHKNKPNADETVKNYESLEDMHNARIQKIKDVCQNKALFTNKAYKGFTTKRYYGSENYNFTYCKVPKSGSTFWTKTFGILKFGVNRGKKMFTLARSKVHHTTGAFIKDIDSVIREKSRTILVSRDPFSRLFSAYIDKSFILLMNYLNFKVRQIPMVHLKSANSCPIDVTFQEFLDWVVAEGEGGKTLNRHWAPIFSLCKPCDVNSFILVKQETFGIDVEYALKTVGVEKEKLDYITPALHDHRAELSLPGIIDTVFHTAQNTIVKYCLGYLKFSRRVWISLQIQGFIDEHIEFPVEKFHETSFDNSTHFSEVVLQTLREFPMSSEQRRHQRQRYLYQAYQVIKPETIEGIQELYKQDFELFGYSKLPPTGSMDMP